MCIKKISTQEWMILPKTNTNCYKALSALLLTERKFKVINHVCVYICIRTVVANIPFVIISNSKLGTYLLILVTAMAVSLYWQKSPSARSNPPPSQPPLFFFNM